MGKFRTFNKSLNGGKGVNKSESVTYLPFKRTYDPKCSLKRREKGSKTRMGSSLINKLSLIFLITTFTNVALGDTPPPGSLLILESFEDEAMEPMPLEEELRPTPSIKNCTTPGADEFPEDLFTLEQRQNGGIAVHFFVSFYLIYALLIVCEKYLVPSIQCLCEDLKIPHSIAGATLMAVSTSAPELFTNIIGTFVTKGDLGVGAIVGAAMFNILAVGAAVGIGTNFAVNKSELSPYSQRSRKGVPLDWWSLSRDSAFFILCILLLIQILVDGRVYWPEALGMLALYGVYLGGMYFDEECRGIVVKLGYFIKRCCCCKARESRRRRKLSVVIKKKLSLDRTGNEEESFVSNSFKNYGGTEGFQVGQFDDTRRVSIVEVVVQSSEASSSSDLTSSSESNISDKQTSGGIFNCVKTAVTLPVNLAFSWTIPDCKAPSNRKWSGLALFICIAWVGVISYLISWMVVVIGETFEIPESVSGLTFLAAGTSLPEVISSVIVARQGLGSMALASSVGSNIWDILICLGVPWLIEAAILSSEEVNFIEIHSGGLQYTAAALIGFFALIYLLIAFNGYILDTKVGVVSIISYVIFVTFACLLEMNVFFPVNLPHC